MKNKATLIGTIVERDKRVNKLNNIMTEYLKIKIDVKGKEDILIVESGNSLCCLTDFVVDDKIKVEGMICSRSFYDPNKTGRTVQLFIMASKILFNTTDEEDLNKIEFDGIVCNDSKVRQTPRGINVCDLLLANNQDKESFYIPSVVWHGNALLEFNVGTKISSLGTFNSRTYKKAIEEEERIAYEYSIRYINLVEEFSEEEYLSLGNN